MKQAQWTAIVLFMALLPIALFKTRARGRNSHDLRHPTTGRRVAQAGDRGENRAHKQEGDGLLQLQPRMYTMDMVNGVMEPMLQSQPGPISANLHWIVNETILHLTAVNLLISFVQICLGLSFLFLSARWMKELVIDSLVWAFIVWYAGEGMSMLLTGQGSALTGAPGAVLLYPLLGLVIYLRRKSAHPSKSSAAKADDGSILSRIQLRRVFSGFWFFAALLPLQPYWWQPGHISQAIGSLVGLGGLNGMVVDPILQRLSDVTASIETPLNIALIVIFLALGIVLAVTKEEQLRPVLIASIVASVVLWYFAQSFGGSSAAWRPISIRACCSW